jgi:cell division protein FtsB
MKPGTSSTEEVVVKTFSAKKSPQELQEENDKLKARVAELEAELAKLKGH